MSHAEKIEASPDEFEDLEYREIYGPAVVGLILGLLACLAMISPLLWLIPAAGVAICLISLRTINRSRGTFVGRKAALFGLLLSVVFGTAAPAATVTYGYLLRREAVPVSNLWFELIRQGDVHKAHQLTVAPDHRKAIDSDLWTHYRETETAKKGLGSFVRNPLVHLLVSLGKKADVRYWDTERYVTKGDTDEVYQIYTVTFDDDSGQKITFYVRVVVQRIVYPEQGTSRWRITKYEGAVRPFEPSQ